MKAPKKRIELAYRPVPKCALCDEHVDIQSSLLFRLHDEANTGGAGEVCRECADRFGYTLATDNNSQLIRILEAAVWSEQ